MRRAIKIDVSNGMITLDDGNQKTIDNYIFELEDRLIILHELLVEYEDVDPDAEYLISGEKIFEVMDTLEGEQTVL